MKMFSERKKSSISRKLTTMNMLVSGIALVVACLSFIGYDLASFREARIASLSTQAEIIGTSCVSALLFNDPQSAESTLSALQASPHIIAAGIYSNDGQPFAVYENVRIKADHGFPRIQADAGEQYWFTSRDVLLLHPIVSGGKQIGFIYIRSDLQALRNRLIQYVRISSTVLIASLLAALLISSLFRRAIADPIVRLAETARSVSRNRNYSVRAKHTSNAGELVVLIDAFNEMLEQIQERDRALQEARVELEQRVEERTTELVAANKELEAFSYSVSHDLRAPLRSIDGFSQIVMEDYGEKLDASGKEHLERIRSATQRMSQLIDDLLDLARVTRSEMQREELDLSVIAKSIAAELIEREPGRNVNFVTEDNLIVVGDARLLRVAMENLLRNAWKFTSKRDPALIEFGVTPSDNSSVFYVRDNGAGFDMRYATKLFGVFQRLHLQTEFPGTGVGLATVQRIVQRHGGRAWGEGKPGFGATFYFELPRRAR